MNDENESYTRAMASFHAPFGTINPTKTADNEKKPNQISKKQA
jgi:hypothetical protein